jgi:hypothetical protein
MWYNGTSLSEKARRALENEKVTIVTHISGFIHTLYENATINKEAYNIFSEKLRSFLHTELTEIVFLNFLRFKSKYKTLFQYRCECSGKQRYIALEKMFEYEHTSKYSVLSDTREALVNEIEGDEFHLSPLPGKIILNDVENIIREGKGRQLDEIREAFIKTADYTDSAIIDEMFSDLHIFTFTDPKIPADSKWFSSTVIPEISPEDSRERIIDTILNLTEKSETALLTLYVYRYMDKINWLPFIKAAIERNPVCFTDLNSKSITEVYRIVSNFPDESIYSEKRLALPDEVWNFKRGDGVEKAFLLADFIVQKDPASSITINIADKDVSLVFGGDYYLFTSSKSFRKSVTITGTSYEINDLS